MMQANELRIGNCIFYNKEVFKIKLISENIVLANRGKGNVEFSINDLESIELTEEILFKCGFKQELIKHQYSFDLITLQLVNENDYHKKGRIYYNSWAIKDECVKHLHQLQNLYFALTNEELKINL